MAQFQREERVASSPRSRFQRTIPLDGVAPRRPAPRRVLHQPQRARPIKRRQRPAVTLDSLNIDSLTLPLALILLTTQFLKNLRRAHNLSCPSIVVPRPKSLGRTSSRRRPSLRATTIAKARQPSLTLVATSTSNLNRLVATGHSDLRGRVCPPCQFISRQAPRPIVPRLTALENRSPMRSSSSTRHSSALKHSKLLPSRLNSKWRLLAVSWSRRPATARFTTSTSIPTVLHLCIFQDMIPACLWWPLPPATRTPMRDRSSTFSLPAPPELLNTLESRASRWQ